MGTLPCLAFCLPGLAKRAGWFVDRAFPAWPLLHSSPIQVASPSFDLFYSLLLLLDLTQKATLNFQAPLNLVILSLGPYKIPNVFPLSILFRGVCLMVVALLTTFPTYCDIWPLPPRDSIEPEPTAAQKKEGVGKNGPTGRARKTEARSPSQRVTLQFRTCRLTHTKTRRRAKKRKYFFARTPLEPRLPTVFRLAAWCGIRH